VAAPLVDAVERAVAGFAGGGGIPGGAGSERAIPSHATAALIDNWTCSFIDAITGRTDTTTSRITHPAPYHRYTAHFAGKSFHDISVLSVAHHIIETASNTIPQPHLRVTAGKPDRDWFFVGN
jgi:hypothetical protein